MTDPDPPPVCPHRCEHDAVGCTVCDLCRAVELERDYEALAEAQAADDEVDREGPDPPEDEGGDLPDDPDAPDPPEEPGPEDEA